MVRCCLVNGNYPSEIHSSLQVCISLRVDDLESVYVQAESVSHYLVDHRRGRFDLLHLVVRQRSRLEYMLEQLVDLFVQSSSRILELLLQR